MKNSKYLAFDIGAESGRAILGHLEDGKISLKEIHRFPNGFMQILDSYHWNVFRLYEAMVESLEICVQRENVVPDAIGIDTWGVDFALLAEDGSILGVPYAYRDARTDNAMEEFFKVISRDRVYELTGIQFLQFNTLFQLYASKRDKSSWLESASDLLFIPDLFNYLLSGEKKSEFTYATTSQLYNPVNAGWEPELFDALGVSMDLMQDIVAPGTVIGALNDHLSKRTGMGNVPVCAVSLHDTGSAIAAVPAKGKNWAYISSGTWSLMGIETKAPLISEKTLKYNLTNEGGVEYTFRVLKNIMGMWPIQQCRKAWSSENYEYADLVDMGKAARPFLSIIDPDAHVFLNPDDMPAAIAGFCKETGQQIPGTHGEFVRVVLESLALKYRYTFDQLNEVADERIEKIYIIGGGIKNSLLCQFTANATGVPVIAALAEGTAVGNLMVQAMAMGEVKSLEEIREVVGNSFEPKTYEPEETDLWESAYERYLKIIMK